MNTSDIRVAILRIEGTNCEDEAALAFSRLGAKPEIIHLKQLLGVDVGAKEKRKLSDYQCLLIPGGFSAGDYVRSGAIWAARMKGTLRNDLVKFVEAGYPVGGICNGFQVLVELGLLPALDATMPEAPTAALRLNDSAHFECRHIYLKHEKTKCAWTTKIPEGKILEMPVAHGEGNFTLPKATREKDLARMVESGQIVFRYSGADGNTGAGYPWNPNGSLADIAGICNPEGNVFGLMPHPERVFDKWNHNSWKLDKLRNADSGMRIDDGRSRKENHADSAINTPQSAMNQLSQGDGRAVFESVLDYIRRKF